MEPTEPRLNTIPEQAPERSIDMRRMIPEFEQQFPKEMAVLRIGGVYPGEQIESLNNPYAQETDTEYFGNVGEHCMAVALCAETMAEAFLADKGSSDIKQITSRALVHDATKRYEAMRKKAKQAGAKEEVYSVSAYEQIRPILTKQGYDTETVDYLAEAGSETGHNSLVRFVKIENGQPVLNTASMADMIVHLADDMTHTPIVRAGEPAKTQFVTVQERMKLSNFPERYKFLYKEGFGFSTSEEPVIVRDMAASSELTNVKSYADWQVWVAEEICKYLLKQTGAEVAGDASEQVKQLVNSKL